MQWLIGADPDSLLTVCRPPASTTSASSVSPSGPRCSARRAAPLAGTTCPPSSVRTRASMSRWPSLSGALPAPSPCPSQRTHTHLYCTSSATLHPTLHPPSTSTHHRPNQTFHRTDSLPCLSPPSSPQDGQAGQAGQCSGPQAPAAGGGGAAPRRGLHHREGCEGRQGQRRQRPHHGHHPQRPLWAHRAGV